MITKFSKFKVKDKQDKKDLPEIQDVNDIKQDTLKRLRDINKDVIKIDKVDENVDAENVFKVRVDVPKDLIKEYIDKVKAEEGKNPLELWSGKDIADEVGKFIINQYLKIDNIPTSVVFGDTGLRDETEERFEQENAEAATDEIDVVEKDDSETAETTEEDFTEDVDKTDEIEVEEEEMFGMSEKLTDKDIKFIKK